MRIGQQLAIGLGIILLFVVFLGAVAWRQTGILWEETEGLYDHPFAVRRALGELKADILVMRIGLKDLATAQTDREKDTIIQAISTADANAGRQFDVLYTKYLGPRMDVEKAHNEYVRWRTVRDEVMRLGREGNTAAVVLRTQSGGVGATQAETLLAAIRKVDDFSMARGDKFYQDARMRRDELHFQLGGAIAFILFLGFVISYILFVGVRAPLKELTTATRLYRQGNTDARSRYSSRNEFGELSASFNELAETMQFEMKGKDDAVAIAEVMLREEELDGFCRAVLQSLLEQTGSQIGAIYLLNEAKPEFVHFASVGLGVAARVSFSAATHEGEFGLALVTKRIQRISNIQADTRFVFATAGGDFHPREIITIPIVSNRDVTAMISLASIHDYSDSSVRLLEAVQSTLTARMNGVLAFEKIKAISEKLETQNRELEAQKKELGAQTDELNQQNVELSMQKHQLEEASRLKSSFLSNMSHELRTPLNSVIALSGVLGRRLLNRVPVEEYGYIEVIERNGKHLLALINDILDLSRVEAGRTEVRPGRFHVRQLVDEVVTMISPAAQEKQIAIQNSVSAELATVVSDVTLCRHILQNLVANAVKFTEKGGVTVDASRDEAQVHIRVSDTGIGIASEKLSTIFDEFRQADESTSRKYGGTGLGLAIAKKYAILLHGSIDVTSTPGQGSVFTVHLPVNPPVVGGYRATADAVDYVAAARTNVPQHLPTGNGKRILLVEDSEPAIVQLKDILLGQGYQVLVARNGREALAQIENSLPDALILDLMMPEVDGLEVLRLIRAQERTAQLPVLILTAKHVTREELSFLTGNHIHQLIQKGDVGKNQLLAEVAAMVSPAAPLQNTTEALAPKIIHSKAPNGKPVVLVVEDNPDNLRTAKALLQDQYTVLEAMDGLAGLEQARKHKPNLILMDIALPLLDGIAALAAIRSDQTLQHIPVIALTASAMKGDREAILKKGFNAYVSKPIDADLLAMTIQEVLDGNG